MPAEADTRSTVAEPLIRIRHLSKTFPGQRALTDVSFEIERGEIHALVGENGSGKSTTIKVLSGFYEPDPGSEVLIGEAPMPFGSPPASWQAGLRFVHQDLGLIDELTGAENVGLASGFQVTAARRVDRRAQRDKTRSLLARIGVDLDVDIPVGQLRAVDRSSLAIARALDDSAGPISLLVLDEPTAALPPAECEALFAVLRDVVASGVAILYVSHRLGEVLGLATRVTVLRDSRCEGTLATRGVDRAQLARLIVGEAVALDGVARPAPVADAGSAPALAVRDLHCGPLAGVEFSVAPGEVLGIAGLSGSGREVLAAGVCGAVPASFSFVLDGAEHHPQPMTPQLARRLRLALVLPNRHPEAAIAGFTVSENMTLGRLDEFARAGRVQHRRERAAVAEWIRRLDIRPPDPHRPYGLLSGGNQQKVLLAKWFGIDPRVVFMDDPTSGVDIGARHSIYELIRAHARTGAGFVICSADLEDLVFACDRVLALADGRIVEELRGPMITEAELLRAVTREAATAGSAPS